MNTTQIQEMLDLQAAMNAKVNPDWRNAGYSWYRAIMMEGAEAIEHHGWKWWKKQEPDMAQLRMELVDIWHFALSDMLVNRHIIDDVMTDAIASTLTTTINRETNNSDRMIMIGHNHHWVPETLLGKLQLMVGIAAVGSFNTLLFDRILKDAGMSWDDLYRQYIGKNVLNFFRQDHGYKEGFYVKIWDGREDNEHLTEIMATLPMSDTYKDDLYAALHMKYKYLAHPN